MVEKGIRGGTCHSVYIYAKTNNKYMKDFDLYYVNNLYGWAMSQKLPVNNFKWIKDTSQFNEYFIKNCNQESEKGFFFKVDVQYIKKIM